MAKLNKKNTEDLFSGLKYVDKLLNEAAGVGNPPKKLSFEEKMKMKLKEGYEEAADLTEEEIDKYSEVQPSHIPGGVDSVKKPHTGRELDEYEYNHPYTNNAEGAGSPYLGEDEMEEDYDFEDDFIDDDDDFLPTDVIGDELGDISKLGGAAKHAARDMADEFPQDEEEIDFNNQEDEMDEEFDFTEDEELMESLLEDEVPSMDTPEDETIPAEGEATPPEATPTDEMPGMEDETGDVNMTTDAGLGSQDAAAPGADMGAELGDEEGTGEIETEPGMSSSPSMGGPSATPSGMDEPAAEMSTTPVDGPEDIDQLIADLVASPSTEEEVPAVFGENAHKELGFTDLKDQDIKSNTVKKESTMKKTVKEGEIKMTKLGDDDITGNVKGATNGKAVTHSGTGKRVDAKGVEYTDLGDDDINSNKVGKAAEKAAAPTQPKFSAIVKENAEKTKALYTLAEKVVTLEDEVTNLKFKTFKLEKVNSILTLLPELKLETRTKLVGKFDECKSYAEAKKLYNEVAEMVKDHKRGTINEAVFKNKKTTKYFTEEVDETETIDRETARRNFLMGLKGFDDQYGVQ